MGVPGRFLGGAPGAGPWILAWRSPASRWGPLGLASRLVVALLLGAAVLVLAPGLVYHYYPRDAVAAATAARGGAPFEAAVSTGSGYRMVSVSGVVVGEARIHGHCVVLLEAGHRRVAVVMPGWVAWHSNGSPLDPCAAAHRLLGRNVVVHGVLRPGPRGPLVVAHSVEGPGVAVTPGPGCGWWKHPGSTGHPCRQPRGHQPSVGGPGWRGG